MGMISNMTFRPWWHENLPVLPQLDSRFPENADVVIIGSGYTGLSAALTLAHAGRDVLILEAGSPGFGASTRNGGQVGSGNQKFRVQSLIALYGREKAKALVRAGSEMLRYIEDLIESESIVCHFKKVGRFRGAVRPAHYESMARDMEDLKRFAGVEYFMVPANEQRTEVGTDIYFGGSVLPHDAALHPGLYHRGLLQRVLQSGGQLQTETRVTGLTSNRSSFDVHTTRGVLTAGEVLVASNGYTGSELPDFKSRLVPVGTSMIATEELPEELMLDLMPTSRVYGNTARVFHYYRPSTDGRRLLFGGRIRRLVAQNSSSAYQHLQREMNHVFPVLSGYRITHGWSGYIGYTKDVLPHLGCHNRIWYAAGYCGTGVSRSTWFGHKVALKILGKDEGKTVFDDLPLSPFRFRRAAPLGVALFESWYRFRDRFYD